MLQQPLSSTDWMLIRLAIIVIDVAAVALIVVLVNSIRPWIRRLFARLSAIPARGTSGSAAHRRVRTDRRLMLAARNVPAAGLLGSMPSGRTAAHRALR